MKKNFVVFLSPGTLVSEQTVKPITTWDIPKAIRWARKIKERHGAVPYGFYFSRRGRKPNELDSKEGTRSKMYYLGGKIYTLKEVKARKDPKDRILISNMENNDWNKIIVNNNSWKATLPFKQGDEVVNY